MVIFAISPCTLGSECKSKSELLEVGFFVTQPIAYTDYGKYDKPVQYFTEKTEHEYVMFNLVLRHKYVYQLTNIAEQKGFLSKEKTTHSFFSVGKFSTGYYERDPIQTTCKADDDPIICSSYYQLEMVVSGTSLKITREYKGIVESISEVGGMVDIVYLIFAFFYGIYHQYHFRTGLADRIYGFRPQSAVHKPQKVRPDSEKISNRIFHMPNISSQDMLELRKQAAKSVEAKLDVVQISKELLALKALAHLLMSSETIELLPLFELKVLKDSQTSAKHIQAQEPSANTRNPQSSMISVKQPNLDSSRNTISKHKPNSADLMKEPFQSEVFIQQKAPFADSPAIEKRRDARDTLESGLLSQLRTQIGENIRSLVQSTLPTNEVELVL